MRYLKIFENWREDTIDYPTIDREKINKLVRLLNMYPTYDKRITDDKNTQDYWNSIRNKIESLLKNGEFNSTEIFETILNLNENGVINLKHDFLHPSYWKPMADMYFHEIKNLKRALEVREEVLKREKGD